MTYQDYKGEIIADFPNGMYEIEEFAKDVGIDTEDLTIIGFELYSHENHPQNPHIESTEIEVHLLAVRKSAWASEYKNFGEYWFQEKKLQVVEFDTGVNLHDFHAKYLKRFQGRLVWPKLQDHELEIESQE